MPRSAANSAGILAFPQSYFNWVRPGIMLYGISPLLNCAAIDLGLRPVMTLRSQLIAIKNLKKGDKIGYGGTWQCRQDTVLGVVAVGYGDGYPRHAKNGTPILVGNVICPLIGSVSMDMITVDLTQCSHAKVGDPVVLWGNGLPIEEVAACAETIGYELACQITARVEKRYV